MTKDLTHEELEALKHVRAAGLRARAHGLDEAATLCRDARVNGESFTRLEDRIEARIEKLLTDAQVVENGGILL